MLSVKTWMKWAPLTLCWSCFLSLLKVLPSSFAWVHSPLKKVLGYRHSEHDCTDVAVTVVDVTEPHWRVKDFIFLNLSLKVAHRLFGNSKCCSIKALWACSVRFMWSRVRPYLPTGVNGLVLIARDWTTSHHRLDLLSCWMLVRLCGCIADWSCVLAVGCTDWLLLCSSGCISQLPHPAWFSCRSARCHWTSELFLGRRSIVLKRLL